MGWSHEFLYGQLGSYFHGILSNIIQLEYSDLTIMNLLLFQCEWFGSTPNRETKVDDKYGIVQVKQSQKYNKAYDPFIFEQQVEKVYYTKYPKGHQGRYRVIKTKTRSRIVDNIVNQVEHETPY